MAALLDRHTGALCVTAKGDYWLRRAPGWVVSEHMFDTTNPVNTSCAVLFQQPTHGLRVADWWVACEQIETGTALVLKIGLLNSTSNPTGLYKEWASSSLLGRDAVVSMERNTNGLCALGTSLPGYDIGVHFSTVAGTPVQSSKRLVMGVLFAPL